MSKFVAHIECQQIGEIVSTVHHVRYQAFCAMYFEADRVLSGNDLGRLWASASHLGNEKCYGSFWHRNEVPDSSRTYTYQVGQPGLFEQLIERNAEPIFGGVSAGQATRRTVDCDFHFSHIESDQFLGHETLPLFLMGVSGQWLERIEQAKFLDMLYAQLEVSDAYVPRYGLFDLAASEDCYSGLVYTPNSSRNAPLHRWIEHLRFVHGSSNRRDQVRGLYWGNYFGPAILERLGGRERFLSGFRSEARDAFGQPTSLVWEFTNGVFVSLSLDPLACKPGTALHGGVTRNLHALVVELGENGAMDPWSRL